MLHEQHHICSRLCFIKSYFIFSLMIILPVIPTIVFWNIIDNNNLMRDLVVIYTLVVIVIDASGMACSLICAFRRKRARFQQRPVLSFDEWYNSFGFYFHDMPIELVYECMDALAQSWRVDKTQIYPSDTLTLDWCYVGGLLWNSISEYETTYAELFGYVAAKYTQQPFHFHRCWRTVADAVRGTITQIFDGEAQH
jgi:hypothetical protein